MKEKILPFIIGILIGAIVTTGGFIIYTKANPKAFGNNKQMMRGERPQMPAGEGGSAEVQKNQKRGKPSEATTKKANEELPQGEASSTQLKDNENKTSSQNSNV